MRKNLTGVSRDAWLAAEEPTHTDINAGSLQRIAAATELMAQRYADLIEERDKYKRWYLEKIEKADRLERQNRSLRGVITRLKRAAEGSR